MFEKLIKGYNNPSDPRVRVRVGRFAGFMGIVSNILLFGIKLFFGIFFGSISIIADSLNNLSDVGSNVLTVVGYTVTGKPADKDHPYGHERMEYLCSLFISVVIIFLGVEMMTSSIDKFITKPEMEKYSALSIIIIASTIAIKGLIAIMYTRLGKHINSSSLRASAIDSISDVFTTSLVVVGMVLTPYTGPYTDAVIGLAISVYIIVMGIKLVKESSSILIGKAPDTEFVHSIIQRIKEYDGVLGIHDLVVHSYGEHKSFVTVHVEVDSDESIMVSHELVDGIEADFLKDGINLVIHMDPVCISDPETSALREMCAKVVSDVAAEYSSPVSMHDFRVVKGTVFTKLLFDVNVSNDMPLSDERLCREISEELKKRNPMYEIILTVDRDYFSSRYENL
ncbi:MAG: cation transporter [Clostridia bacterium]|nr:cation transporter [Clostridia bacterium]